MNVLFPAHWNPVSQLKRIVRIFGAQPWNALNILEPDTGLVHNSTWHALLIRYNVLSLLLSVPVVCLQLKYKQLFGFYFNMVTFQSFIYTLLIKPRMLLVFQ